MEIDRLPERLNRAENWLEFMVGGGDSGWWGVFVFKIGWWIKIKWRVAWGVGIGPQLLFQQDQIE